MSEPHIPEGLLVANSVRLEAKMADFARIGASGMHVVLDFDRTLTVRRPGSHDDVTTWHILREHLPKDAQMAYQRLFEKYRTLELDGTMTQKDAADWWSSVLDIFVEHHIDIAAVEKDFLDRASIRPGAVELFRLCADNAIPTIILSAGIRDVIDIWCRKYAIKPTLVISTALVVDDNSKIVGWQKDTLVHVLNKSETTHPDLLAIRGTHPKVFLVGDSLDDAAMVAGEMDVVRTRILDLRSDEASSAQGRLKTFQKFDALIESGTLDPLCELIELVVRYCPR